MPGGAPDAESRPVQPVQQPQDQQPQQLYPLAIVCALIVGTLERFRANLRTVDAEAPKASAVSAEARRALEALSSILSDRTGGSVPLQECFGGLVSTMACGLRRHPPRHDPATTSIEQTLLHHADGGTSRITWRRRCRPSDPHAFVAAPPTAPPRGVVLLLPGLNNNSRWGFLQRLMAALCEGHGFDVALLDSRGYGGLPLTSARVHCADGWRDLPDVVAALRRRYPSPGMRLFAVGHSMGGMNLLKYLSTLGERGEASPFAACATVSAPVDLSRHMRTLEATPVARMVNFATAAGAAANFLRLYLRQVRLPGSAHEHLLGKMEFWRVLRATSLRRLEAASIVPLHGYTDPEDYYEANRPLLRHVRGTPILVLHAEDDPVISARDLPAELRAHADILFVLTKTGGHLGYAPTAAAAAGGAWADELCARFFALHCDGTGAAVAAQTAANTAAQTALPRARL